MHMNTNNVDNIQSIHLAIISFVMFMSISTEIFVRQTLNLQIHKHLSTMPQHQ